MRYRDAVISRPSLRAALLVATLLSACAGEPGSESQDTPSPEPEMFSESESYERFMGRWSRPLAFPFLEFASVEDGDSLLDVGSGTGALSAAVLSQTETARVVGIDPSSAYVAYARQHTRNDRSDFEVGDGQQLRFPDASFDKTLSLLVINFIPDPGKALDEMIRVTRPGGVIAATVWDYDQGMEMLRIFWDEVVALDPSSETRDERHMPFCKPGELASLWKEHGLVGVEEAPLVVPLEFSSFESSRGALRGEDAASGETECINPYLGDRTK